jgi:predicted O-methyltransferase YrrM
MADFTDEDVAGLRSRYREAVGQLTSPSPAASRVLEEIVAHPRFPGVTDPPALALLETLLRITQPERVLELGTYIGLSSVFIADVLQQNQRQGHLWTVDPDASAHSLASEWLTKAGLENAVSLVGGLSTAPEVARALRANGPFEFVYLDSSHAYGATLKELELVFEDRWLSPGGLLLLHDASDFASRWDPTNQGGVRRALNEWTAAHLGEYYLAILEPPLWPSATGVGLLSRRQSN